MTNAHTPTVTVGISALNEEKNIIPLLAAVIAQKTSRVTLERVLVVSDGSTDATASNAASLGDKRIHVIAHPQRAGKIARMNEMLETATSDIIILLDADIYIPDNALLETLIAPMIADSTVAAVSGRAKPLPPTTFVQKVVMAGTDLWDDLRITTPGAEMHLSEGTVRAFRRSLYRKMRFAESMSDEVFPYLYCKKFGYTVAFAPDALVYYALPKTYRDYSRQMLRFLSSERAESRELDAAFIDHYYVIRTHDKLRVLFSRLVRNPIWTTLYIFFLLPPKLSMLFKRRRTHSSQWAMATSTKGVV